MKKVDGLPDAITRLESVSIELNLQVDKLKTYVDSLDDMRRRIYRVERKIYRDLETHGDNGSDDQGDMSWIAGVK